MSDPYNFLTLREVVINGINGLNKVLFNIGSEEPIIDRKMNNLEFHLDATRTRSLVISNLR